MLSREWVKIPVLSSKVRVDLSSPLSEDVPGSRTSQCENREERSTLSLFQRRNLDNAQDRHPQRSDSISPEEPQ